MMHVHMMCVCLMHVSMMRVFMMHGSMIHISMVHVSMMIFDPDTCMYDAYIYGPWFLILMLVCMILTSMILHPDACMYDACMMHVCGLCMYDACQKWGRTDEQTDWRTDSWILGVGFDLVHNKIKSEIFCVKVIIMISLKDRIPFSKRGE